MMAKLAEFFSKVENLEYPHKGVVVSNEDPEKLGRLKLSISGLFADTDDLEKLPWSYPMVPAGLGGGVGSHLHAVPEVGAELMVVFPYKDIYFPVYVSYYLSEVTKLEEFDFDYPESYGWKDSQDTLVFVNKKKKNVKIKHGPSGDYITIDEEGNIVIETMKNGNVKVIAPGSIKLDAPVVHTTRTLEVGEAASGVFASYSGQIITVKKGIITNIA